MRVLARAPARVPVPVPVLVTGTSTRTGTSTSTSTGTRTTTEALFFYERAADGALRRSAPALAPRPDGLDAQGRGPGADAVGRPGAGTSSSTRTGASSED